MERRFLLFLILSFGVLTVSQYFMTPPPKPKPAAAQGEKAEAEQAAELKAAEGVEKAPADAAPVAAAAGEQAVDPAAEADVPQAFVTLGSVDESTGYQMLVTLTNQGAAVQRAELSSPRYLDVHERGGYLGHLELAADGGAGLLVQAVGAGTPAAVAGVQVGDRLVEAGRDALAPLATAADLAKVLVESRPKQKLSLAVERGGQRQTLTATLQRRPLEVIRPEAENVLLRTGKLPADFTSPPSFLLTLQEVDAKKIADDAQALPGVDLHDANWRIVPSEGAGDGNSESVTFERRVPEWGLVVTKRYRLSKAPEKIEGAELPAYDLTLELTIRNEGEANEHTVAYRLDGPNGLPIEGWWYATKIGRTWSAAGIRDVLGRYFGAEPHQQGAPQIATGDVEPFQGTGLAYMGVDAQYFCVALIPQVETPEESDWITEARSVVAGTLPNLARDEGRFANVTCRLFSRPMALKPGESITNAYTVFVGPKRPELLAQYKAANQPAYSLSDFVYYGWFGAVAKAMVGLLHIFYGWVGNYGIAIIMLTVLVRGCMFPVSRGQAKSMVKMQELRPEMDRIKEKYKGDQQKQAQAMQQLYRKHNVNPLAGCLPMLIQLPVFIGLYRGLAVDVELRQAPLFGQAIRWCSNLAAPDMLYDWSWLMPDFVNRGEGIFGLGPYLNVLPLVTVALFLLQQKMFMPEPANEQAALQQKIMKYMMVFMGLMFYKVPSGLCLYFIASSLWGIAEKKMIPPPKPVEGSDGGASDLPSTKSKSSGGTPPEKRAPKNGQVSGRAGAKSKSKRKR